MQKMWLGVLRPHFTKHTVVSPGWVKPSLHSEVRGPQDRGSRAGMCVPTGLQGCCTCARTLTLTLSPCPGATSTSVKGASPAQHDLRQRMLLLPRRVAEMGWGSSGCPEGTFLHMIVTARPCLAHAGTNTLLLLLSFHPFLGMGALPRDEEPPPGWGLVLATSPISSLQVPASKTLGPVYLVILQTSRSSLLCCSALQREMKPYTFN